MPQTTYPVQSVLGVRVLVFDFGLYACAMRCPVLTSRMVLPGTRGPGRKPAASVKANRLKTGHFLVHLVPERRCNVFDHRGTLEAALGLDRTRAHVCRPRPAARSRASARHGQCGTPCADKVASPITRLLRFGFQLLLALNRCAACPMQQRAPCSHAHLSPA
eukprot:3428677-Rhodomonas_salina.1